MLAKQPRQNIIVLHAAVLLIGDSEEENPAQIKELFEETQIECEVREAEKMTMQQFLNCIDELAFYNLIKLDRNKKDPKLSLVSLNVSLDDLTRELAALQSPDTHVGK